MTRRLPSEDTLSEGRISRREFLGRALRSGARVAAVGGALAETAGPGRVTGEVRRGRELTVAQGGDVSTLDPHFSSSANDTRVSFNIFDNLVSRHPDGLLYPGLATEWTVAGPIAYRFRLRPDVTWHDGDPFTAADAKFSLERTYDPAVRSRVATVFTTIDRIEAPDRLTLLIHTRRFDPLLPARLASFGGQIVPRRYLQRVGADGFAARPVGTGPVRFVSWTKEDRLVLEANPSYWGGPIDADRVIFRPIPETEARIAALLKGEVDLATPLPSDQWERVQRHPATRAVGTLYAGLLVLGVNSTVPPLNNPLIRQALSLAVDRETLVRELWRGRGLVPNGPIPVGDRHHDPSLPPLAYDPQEARERLRRAGYRGEPITIETTAGYIPQDRAMSEAIAATWRDVGFHVVVEALEYSVRAQKMRTRSFKGLWWAEPTSTLRDPDGMLWRLLAPGAVFDYWRHPEFDELGGAARFSADERFRGEAYRKMTRIFLEHNPWIIVLQPYEDYGMRREVEFTPHPLQYCELRRFNLRLGRG